MHLCSPDTWCNIIPGTFNSRNTPIFVHRCGAGCSMRACHPAGPGSKPGRDKFSEWCFLEFFSQLLDKCQEALDPQGPRISFGRHNHSFIFALLEWMGMWMVCKIFHVRVVSEVPPGVSWSLIRGGPLCPCVIKKVCTYSMLSRLIPSTNRSWVCKARVACVT